MENPIKFRRVHRGVLDTSDDVLVPDRLTLGGLDFFAQRKRCANNSSFFLTPWQYFSLRTYVASNDLAFDEAIRENSQFERFDQIINVSVDPPMAYTNPKVDFEADTLEKSEGVEIPYVLEIPFRAGFTFYDLDGKTGLPRTWCDNWGKPQTDKLDDMAWWEGYRVFNPPNWPDILDGWNPGDLQLTPLFRAKYTEGSLYISPPFNAAAAMDNICVRECYLASEENLKKLKGQMAE